MQRNGVFFYSPGCLSSPMMRGNTNNGGATVILSGDLKPTVNADSFDCATRAPAGGFVMSVESTMGTGNVALIQSDDVGNWSEITSEPSTWAYVMSLGNLITFAGRPVEVGPSGAIYVVALDTIYRLSP